MKHQYPGSSCPSSGGARPLNGNLPTTAHAPATNDSDILSGNLVLWHNRSLLMHEEFKPLGNDEAVCTREMR